MRLQRYPEDHRSPSPDLLIRGLDRPALAQIFHRRGRKDREESPSLIKAEKPPDRNLPGRTSDDFRASALSAGSSFACLACFAVELYCSGLLRLCHFLHDREGFDVEVHYLRDRAGREVDFLITVDRKPWFAVEAKLSATTIEPSLAYFLNCLRIPWAYQVVLKGQRDFVQNGIRCVPARQFLGALV